MPPNRLINEKSPYLLQHAHNPVDWHPWSDNTFERARTENKPVFLSIGYATCHWCHVMEKESFEDKEAAEHLNDTFICIKVDREERPDIDAVYMAACQMLTGSGGWPLTIFMTPDKKPFHAATYIPKLTRFGRPGLIDLCQRVKTIWSAEKEKVLESAESISGNLSRAFSFAPDEELDRAILKKTRSLLEIDFDSRFGGFGTAPKFPTPHQLMFLLREHHRTGDEKALEMVEKTLTAMRMGGIWDHVGFGFHRYSTDKQWLLPHFEKMLYDQALQAQAYLETFQTTKDPFYSRTAEEIFTYVLRDMTSDDGAFFAAEDADSEGEEGKFYVWAIEAFRNVLGNDADPWERIFNLKVDGNFTDEATGRKTGANIPHLDMSMRQWSDEMKTSKKTLERQWEDIRNRLFDARKQRIHPLKDDKVLTNWNGLMIAAFALGARILDKPQYARAAERAARFILSRMRNDRGRLFHRFRDGETAISGNAEDYAFFVHGLLELYGTTFDPEHLQEAIDLQNAMIADFWDESGGGFYLTEKNSRDLPVRPKELYDGAIPSSNSVSLLNLLRLSRLTGDALWEQKASELTQAFSGAVKKQPTAFTFFLMGFDFAVGESREVVVAGKTGAADTEEMFAALNKHFAPNTVVLFKSDEHSRKLSSIAGFTDGLQVVQGRATAHVCKGFNCKEPTTDLDAMVKKVLENVKPS